MAICQIFDNPDVNEERWEHVDEHVRATGPVPTEGRASPTPAARSGRRGDS